MADYYPLIARAVGGLDRNTGENRRALYDRARSALVSQLRGVEPALNETDITRERLALEEAIRKVEAEAAKRPRGDGADGETPEPSLRDRGLRDFRETVAEAEGLGGAAAEARRAAHATYESMPVEPAPLRHYPEPPAIPEPSPVTEASTVEEKPRDIGHIQPPPSQAPFDDDEYTRPARSYAGLIKLLALAVILAGIGGGLYSQRHAISSLVASFRSQPATKPREAAQPAERPKIADRIGQSGGQSTDTNPTTANAPAAAVAQKVVLYDEDPNDPQGKRYVGSALWRTETVSPGPGLAPELAVRADIEIPERKLRMTWSLRRNTDKALPASHTIEIMFTLPPDFPEGGIGNVPGVLMKQSEQARGVPLAGLAVKVTDGYFLIGLSAVDVDVQRNIQLLKERDWFDIPVVYTSGKRAILAMEKGTPGTRAFEEAFRAWGQ
ncbi:MAG TPA: hypothetical protein VJR71_09300 [Pseudolabrys sp.]|nr:hypothetical protein [Pseudolabrys sp.]